MLGIFDPLAVPEGWFDALALESGWFDEDLLQPTQEPEPPEPEPEPSTQTAGAPGNSKRRPEPRIAVRIDGVLHVGPYAEINALVAALAQRDAAQAALEAPVAVTRPKIAKRIARKAAQRFERSMQVIDVGLPTAAPASVDPVPIAMRDLRAEYLRIYAAALLVVQREAEAAAAEQTRLALEAAARRDAIIEADDLEVIDTLLEIID